MAAVERIVVQATALDKAAFAAKAKKLDMPLSELMRRGAFAYQSSDTDAELGALAEAAMYFSTHCLQDPKGVSVGAVPFLHLFGIVAGGWQLMRGAVAAQKKIDAGDNDPFYISKVLTARFFADHALAAAKGLAYTVKNGGAAAVAITDEMF